MNCPKCNGRLEVSQQGPYTCSLCPDCYGIWVSGNEIRKVLNAQSKVKSLDGIYVYQEGSGKALKNGKCPKCIESQLFIRNIQGVELEICENCNGAFFDKNEMNELFPKVYQKATPSDALTYGAVESAIWALMLILSGS